MAAARGALCAWLAALTVAGQGGDASNRPNYECEPGCALLTRQADYHEFRCADGLCIPASGYCNGAADCEDGSDEDYCPPGRPGDGEGPYRREHAAELPYDCYAGLPEEWSPGKGAWCCLHTAGGRGCPADLAAGRPEDGCEDVRREPSAAWPAGKRAYCCLVRDVGCLPASGGTAGGGAGTSQRPQAPTTPPPYSCSDDEAWWDSHQHAWCCQHEGRGCTDSSIGQVGVPSTRVTSTSTTSRPYNCSTGSSQTSRWSARKRHWCCTHHGRGCSTTTTRSTSTSTRTQTTSTRTSTPLPFDCQADLESVEDSWSARKAEWCCAHMGLGCRGHAGASASAPLFQCGDGGAADEGNWSADELEWCCTHRGLGCPTTPSSRFDCMEGYADWARGWSQAKKRWCCQMRNRGCQTTTVRAPHDCGSGRSDSWPAGKRAYCCAATGTGCKYTGTTTTSTAPQDGEANPSGHELAANDTTTEPAEAMSTSAEAVPEAVPKAPASYDCRSRTATWSAAQRAWCCSRGGHAGCPPQGRHAGRRYLGGRLFGQVDVRPEDPPQPDLAGTIQALAVTAVAVSAAVLAAFALWRQHSFAPRRLGYHYLAVPSSAREEAACPRRHGGV